MKCKLKLQWDNSIHSLDSLKLKEWQYWAMPRTWLNYNSCTADEIVKLVQLYENCQYPLKTPCAFSMTQNSTSYVKPNVWVCVYVYVYMYKNTREGL